MKIRVKNFSLKHTLECGQTFRWHKIDDWYYTVRENRLIKVKQQGNYLITNSSKNILNYLLRLDDDLNKIYKKISKDKIIKQAIKNYKGLRLVREDPFQCLISYICSANTNIPNIKRQVLNLSKKFGKKVDGFYAFPSAKRLAKASLKQLKGCKLGFKAKYVLAVSKFIASKRFNLNRLRNMTYKEAKKELIKLPGVGSKIADCVLLYAFDKMEAFPVDVWIRRVMQKYYFKGKMISNEKIVKFAQKYFDGYAGYAQEYLFYWAKNNKLHWSLDKV